MTELTSNVTTNPTMPNPTRRGRASAFSLIELLLVLVILAVLAALVIPKFTGRSEQARRTAAQTQISGFSARLSEFEIDTGRYPTTEEGLNALVERPSNVPEGSWAGYLERIPKDPWGNAYQYEQPGRHNERSFDVSSAGPDGRHGTDDDITNWDEAG